jgi:hypothetical protein
MEIRSNSPMGNRTAQTRANVDALLSVVKSHAPGMHTQLDCDSYVQHLRNEDVPDTHIEAYLVQILHDGLAYGNWPWFTGGPLWWRS